MEKAPTREIGYVSQKVTGWDYFADDVEDNFELRFPYSIRRFGRMRREETQLQSVLKAVKLPILRTKWSLDPAGAPDEVVDFVAQNLGLPVAGRDLQVTRRSKGRFSWREHLQLALTELDFGFAVFEQVYEIRDGKAWLRKLGYRPQSSIQSVDVDRDGGLVAIVQKLSVPGKETRIPVSRLVAYVNEREGANWTGVSLLRPSYKYWLLKDRLLRVQAMTVERNGLGIPVYEASSQDGLSIDAAAAGKAQKDELDHGQKIASGLRAGETAGAAIPHGAKLALLGVTGQLPDAKPAIEYYDEQMAKSALAHFLTLGTQTGSWALGTTFADFFTLSLQTVAEHIAETANQHIIEDLVDINFGEDMPAPRLIFEEIGSQAAPTAQALQSLVQTKVIRPDDTLESFMRNRFGLPKADPETAREISNNSPVVPEQGEQDDQDER